MMRYSRKLNNFIFICLCSLALMIVTAITMSLFASLIKNGVQALNFSLLTQSTPPPGISGGLLNAITGTIIITGIAILVATPLGILAAVYLREFSHNKKLINAIRLANDILLSTPSIIIGLFCYALLVVPMQHFSALAGAIALAMIAMPIITRTCEDMLTLAPKELREAAYALGLSSRHVIFNVIVKSVMHGIVTGILLASARILGETAPLLFTSLNNQFFTASLNKPMASLPVVIYQYAMSPYADWQHLAWSGALLITLIVCLLNLISRLIERRKERLA